ncbi:hypothetical protein [Microbacterium saperdae]|uniref:Uncharacterized protein n=1 Tax=Microbacterium saperdae TaxID=69368 RepID=A0A543BCD1_9MICO|nr:hypothetical protein [Microbacterium saperdae]TQL82510.1 hypothetical protein FB560_4003 [Microbacterium saperdae]GGM40507.1 hypothetical protein GCM10010489_09350 [Microbacterium saperdae]
MRGLAVVVGGLLLVGGAVLVVVADQERVAALDEIRAQVVKTEKLFDDTRAENLRLAEQLTALRSQIAEQDAVLSDSTGFLQ